MVSPQVIVVSGGVLQRTSLFAKIRPHCTAHLQGYVPKYADAMDTIIQPSIWGNDAGIIGALNLATS